MRQVSRCTITVILEQAHFQSFPEHWQWNVQQTEIGWKTVPHDWRVNGKTAVSIVCPRTWNSELAGLSRAQMTPIAVGWRWLTVCRQDGGAMPCRHLYNSTAVLKVIRWRTGSQCSWRRIGVMRSDLLAPVSCSSRLVSCYQQLSAEFCS